MRFQRPLLSLPLCRPLCLPLLSFPLCPLSLSWFLRLLRLLWLLWLLRLLALHVHLSLTLQLLLEGFVRQAAARTLSSAGACGHRTAHPSASSGWLLLVERLREQLLGTWGGRASG